MPRLTDKERNSFIKVILYRVRINKGGYDSLGHYWGIGQPLYYYEYPIKVLSYGREINSWRCSHMRAADREHAKDLISFRIKRDHDKEARFYK